MRPLTRIVVLAVALAGCRSEPRPPADGGQVLAAGLPVPTASASGGEQDSTPMVVRRVWGGPDVPTCCGVSSDGRYLAFVSPSGDLAIRDFSTGEVRLLTDDASWMNQWVEDAAISPDGGHIAYVWYRDDQEHHYELRVVGWDGGNPRFVFGGESFDWYGTAGWSPDGDQILISGSGVDGSYKVALVSVADGSERTLKEMGSSWRWPVAVSLSPDARHLVYDLPRDRYSEERDVFLLTVHSGEEVRLIQHPANDFVLGWAPDGKHFLFASDRTGTLGAWMLPVAEGRAVGEPRLVKPDMWRVSPIGFTSDGSFFYGVPMDNRVVYVASIDPETGAVLAAPTAVGGDNLARNSSPEWSPDGRYLAYLTLEGQQAGWYTGEYTISIRSVETGEARQLRVPDLDLFGDFRWFAEGQHLLVPGVDRNERDGVFKVDIQTGEAEPLPAFWDIEIARLIDWAPDAGSVYYRVWQGEETRIAVMDLERGVQRVLSDEYPNPPVALSPDGRQLAFAVGGGGERSLMLMPATGGVPRELHRFQTEKNYNVFDITWSVDGRYLLYVRPWDGAVELWRVPGVGGEPEKLDLSANRISKIRFHPDGRRIAFEAGSRGAEIWVMENFLPETPGAPDEE
ncbi:MAG: PD40 domain-containing protein [Gemmatimonadota bacterium]|nr:MAG: PD40 domain-containing protein [Gemmatimonadota bacterium]